MAKTEEILNEAVIHEPRMRRDAKGLIGVVAQAEGEHKRFVGQPVVCTDADGMGSSWVVLTTGDRVSSRGASTYVRVVLLEPGQEITIKAGYKDSHC